jgi:hypothetical protein
MCSADAAYLVDIVTFEPLMGLKNELSLEPVSGSF